MAKRQDWIKLHARDLRDPDVQALTRPQRAVYWELQLLSKSYSEENGYLISDGEPMTDTQIAKALGSYASASIAEVVEAIESCLEHGLLERTEASGLHIVNWNLRQAAELREDPANVARRGRIHRAKLAAQRKAAEKTMREAGKLPEAPPSNVTELKRRDGA